MLKNFKQSLLPAFLVLLTLAFMVNINAASAAEVTVGSFTELQEAVADITADPIVISGDIMLTQGVEIDRDLTIIGGKEHSCTTSDEMAEQDMFTITGNIEVTLASLDIVNSGDLAIAVVDGANATITNNSIDCDDGLGGIGISNASATIVNNYIDDVDLAAIVLESGTQNVTIQNNRIEDTGIAILTYHDTKTLYSNAEMAIKNIDIISNDIEYCELGLGLMPNTASFDIASNDFKTYIAGVAMVPAGVAELEKLIEDIESSSYAAGIKNLRKSSKKDFEPSDIAAIQQLAAQHLFFSSKTLLPQNITIRNNKFTSRYTGVGIAGCSDNISLSDNTFISRLIGAVVTGIPGKMISDIFNTIIKSSAHLPFELFNETILMNQLGLQEINIPDYPAYATTSGNRFVSNWGMVVALNAGAEVANSNFGFCDMGVAIFTGPGDSVIKDSFFYECRNAIMVADEDSIKRWLLSKIGLKEIPTWEEISGDLSEDISKDLYELLVEQVDSIELAPSTTLIQNNGITNTYGDSIAILAKKADTMVRFNNFNSTFGMPCIRVGWNSLESKPSNVSISENTFATIPAVIERFKTPPVSKTNMLAPKSVAAEMPKETFVLFDVDEIVEGYHVNLNTFKGLQSVISPDKYALIVSADSGTLDATRNTWISGDVTLTANDIASSEILLGSIDYSPVYTDKDIDDAPEEFGIVSTDSGDITFYSGNADGNSFDVAVPSGAPKPFINPVDEERVRNAMTEAELKEIKHDSIFYVPVDIRFETIAEEKVVLRFENVNNLENDDLIVKSTTPSGVIVWGDNAYISDDGKWIILEIGSDTTPSFADLTGSVTVAGSKATSSGGSSSGGGCNNGFFAPAALLLLAPLFYIRKR